MIKVTLTLLSLFFLIAGAKCSGESDRLSIQEEASELNTNSQNTPQNNLSVSSVRIDLKVTNDVGTSIFSESELVSMSFVVQTHQAIALQDLTDYSGIRQSMHHLIYPSANPLDFMYFDGYVTNYDTPNEGGALSSQKHWASFIRVRKPQIQSDLTFVSKPEVGYLYYGVIKGKGDNLFLIYGDQIHIVESNLFEDQEHQFGSLPLKDHPSPAQGGLPMQYVATMTNSFDRAHGGIGLYNVLGSYVVRKKIFKELYNINLNLFAVYTIDNDPVSDMVEYSTDSEVYTTRYIKGASQLHAGMSGYSHGRKIPFYMHYTDDPVFEKLQRDSGVKTPLGLSFIDPVCNKTSSGQTYSSPYNTIIVRPFFENFRSLKLSGQYLLDAHENYHMFGAQHLQELILENPSRFTDYLMYTHIGVNKSNWKMTSLNTDKLFSNINKVKSRRGEVNRDGFCL